MGEISLCSPLPIHSSLLHWISSGNAENSSSPMVLSRAAPCYSRYFSGHRGISAACDRGRANRFLRVLCRPTAEGKKSQERNSAPPPSNRTQITPPAPQGNVIPTRLVSERKEISNALEFSNRRYTSPNQASIFPIIMGNEVAFLLLKTMS